MIRLGLIGKVAALQVQSWALAPVFSRIDSDKAISETPRWQLFLMFTPCSEQPRNVALK